MRNSKNKMRVFGLIVASLAIGWLFFSGDVLAAQKELTFVRPNVDIIDPGPSADSDGVINMSLVYNGLVTLDRKGNVIPDLAESWKISPDYKEFTFVLRKGIQFHDGSPFTAKDVKFSFDRVWRIGRTAFGNWKAHASENSCEVVDDYTLTIRLVKPFPIFLMDLTAPSYLIVSSSFVKQHVTADDPEALKYMTDHACGTGPYKLVEWTPGERVVFDKFDKYWGGPKGGKTAAKTNRVIFKIMKDPTTAGLMLEKGDVDIAEKLTVEQFQLLKKKPGIKVIDFAEPSVVYLMMDVSKPPFDDINVRKAMSHAVNYDEIINSIEKGTAKRMRGMIPEGIMGYNPTLALYQYDLNKAMEFMKKSKYPKGFTTTLLTAPERRKEFEQVAEYVQAYLKKIGITVNVQKLAMSAEAALVEKGNYGIALNRWTTVVPDPDDNVGWLYDSTRASGGWAGAYWDDKDVQAKLHKAAGTINLEERKALYQEVDRKAVDEAIFVNLYQLGRQIAVRQNIKNFHYDSFVKYYLWETVKE